MVTKQDLLVEQQALDQQEAKQRETVSRAEQVRAAALQRLAEVNGARAMVAHLLKKFDAKEQTDEQGDQGAGKSSAPTAT